jgi:hypothetical protein
VALQGQCPARHPLRQLEIPEIGNEFLFDVVKDQRERANLVQRHPTIFKQLKAQWEQWNTQMLPITADVRTHGVSGQIQADRYGIKGVGGKIDD